jgi:hypothetical protein
MRRAFRDNDIEGEILRRLTAEDLCDLGVASIGHRRRLLDAIAALGAGQLAEARPPVQPRDAAGEAERGQITVMFSDLVGSTALAACMDPDDLREVFGLSELCRLWRNTWATVSWCTTAIRRRMRTTPSERCGQDWS